MPVKIKPVSQIKMRLGIDPNGPVRAFFTSTCAKHMDKYVPMDEGVLRQYTIDGSYIIYDTPSDEILEKVIERLTNKYAKYQYYGIRNDGTHKVSNYTTPGTGPYWDKRMKSAEMQDIENEMQSFIEHSGGK